MTPGAFWVISARAKVPGTVAVVVTSPAPTSSASARATASAMASLAQDAPRAP